MALVWREAGLLGVSLSSANSAVPSAFQPSPSNPPPPELAGGITVLFRLSRPCQFHASQDVAGIM